MNKKRVESKVIYVGMYLCKTGFNIKFKAKMNSIGKTNTLLNHLNMIKSNLQPQKSFLTLHN